MKTTLLLLFIVWISTAYALDQKQPPPLSYLINLHFNPDSGYLHGRAEIRHPSDSVFILTKSLAIKSVEADGRKVLFHQRTCQSVPHSVEIAIGSIPGKLVIEYSGKIKADDYPKTTSSLNQINAGLIELSDHIDWYPRLKGWKPFSYVMTVDVPGNFHTITNGLLVGKEKKKEKRHISTWRSESPAYGITLLSIPGLSKTELIKGDHTIEIYSARMPQSYVDSMKYSLLQSVQMLDSLFGPTDEKLVRLVYSPRQAGAYARRPLLIVSEYYALEQRGHAMGFARDFRLNCHEIAHYWSRARSDTPDDWINEGLAEFAALLISEKVIGKEFANILKKEYQGIIDGTPTQTAIVETTDGSVEREINRYYKPTFLLNSLREKVGDEKLKYFFKLLYQKFNQANTATTALFLEALQQSTGSETEAVFREAIFRKGWKNELQVSLPPVLSDKNEVFLGKWSGNLTQFGASTRFILNLVNEGGKIIPTLDSPDQDVTGIPASELHLQGDSISFKVSVASASYHGRLNREKLLIEGKWSQRNIDYPLNVIKVKEE